ncbi:MAG: hypothetical protein ABIS50_01915 [Luteolibacter sp.]
MTTNPILTATTWKETIPPGEGEEFRALELEIQRRQTQFAERPGEPLLGFHTKFCVLPDLPPHARQGDFREQKAYPAVVRFSNGEHMRRPDGSLSREASPSNSLEFLARNC